MQRGQTLRLNDSMNTSLISSGMKTFANQFPFNAVNMLEQSNLNVSQLDESILQLTKNQTMPTDAKNF